MLALEALSLQDKNGTKFIVRNRVLWWLSAMSFGYTEMLHKSDLRSCRNLLIWTHLKPFLILVQVFCQRRFLVLDNYCEVFLFFAHFSGTVSDRCTNADIVTEPVLQWSLGKKVPPPPTAVKPVKVSVSNSPCSRDAKVLLVQFTKG